MNPKIDPALEARRLRDRLGIGTLQGHLLKSPQECGEAQQRSTGGWSWTVCTLPNRYECPYPYCVLQKMPHYHEPREALPGETGPRKKEVKPTCQN